MGINVPRSPFFGTPPIETLLGISSAKQLARSVAPSLLPQWLFVVPRFNQFIQNLNATPLQLEDYNKKVQGLLTCLNGHYWPDLQPGNISVIIGGSWGNGTQIRLGSDIDLIFLLPWAVQTRHHNRTGNIQSQILQEVKNILIPSYPTSNIKGDAPTVVVDFATMKIEIAPVFRFASTPIVDDSFLVQVCHSKNGGSYKASAPIAEASQVTRVNSATNGNLLPLIRMAKAWKYTCAVPIKSIVLQNMAADFLLIWAHSQKNAHWYDWMIRDFFAYILTQQNKYTLLPGSNEILPYGNEWAPKANLAHRAATTACIYEEQNYNALAGEQWQKIFGNFIPKEV